MSETIPYAELRDKGTAGDWSRGNKTNRLIDDAGYPIGELYVYSERHGGDEAEANAALVAHEHNHFAELLEVAREAVKSCEGEGLHVEDWPEILAAASKVKT